MADYHFPAMASLDTAADKFTFLAQQAAAVAQAMAHAKAIGDTQDLANLRSLLLKIRSDTMTLIGEAQAEEMPSAFMQQLAAFGDQTSALIAEAGGGIAGVVSALPLILIGLVIVAGIGLYKGTLSVKPRLL